MKIMNCEAGNGMIGMFAWRSTAFLAPRVAWHYLGMKNYSFV